MGGFQDKSKMWARARGRAIDALCLLLCLVGGVCWGAGEGPFFGSGQWVSMALRVAPYKGEVGPVIEMYQKMGFDAVAVGENFMSKAASFHNPPRFVVMPCESAMTPAGEIRGIGVMRPMPVDPSEALGVIDVWEGFSIWMPQGDTVSDFPAWAGKVHAIEARGAWLQKWAGKTSVDGPWISLSDPDPGEELGVPKQAWVEVWVLENDPRNILDSLRKGMFYATNGPILKILRVSKREVRVEWSGQETVRILGPDGTEVAKGSGPEMRWSVPRSLPWVRVEMVGPEDSHAWTQPVEIE